MYFFLFCLFTYGAITKFSTHFFAPDFEDGLQSIWNIWWVNAAVTELWVSPWHTMYLHFPFGVSLLGHTLHPLKGFLAVPLLQFFSLVHVYNILFILSFVMGGFTMFLLAWTVSRSYWGSVLGGAVFTFSNFHFAHAGQLQMVSLEWIPLFLLCWYCLLERPRCWLAATSAVVLLLNLLSDHYYFLYAVLGGAFMVGWHCVRRRDARFFLRREHLLPFGLFVLLTLLLTGPFIISFLLFAREPMAGIHPAKLFSMDLLSPVLPGGYWLFRGVTKFYWSGIPPAGNYENSVHLGFTVITILLLLWMKRRRFAMEKVSLWFGMFLFFFIMSLGPVLRIGGNSYEVIKLPYSLLEILLPPMRLSGVPVRMMVMVYLSAAILLAVAWRPFVGSILWRPAFVVLFLLAMLVEYLPRPLPLAPATHPSYVRALAAEKGDGGVLDLVAQDPKVPMYHQTLHKKPIAFGFVSRTPLSVLVQERAIVDVVDKGALGTLCTRYGIRYLIAPAAYDVPPDAVRLLFREGDIALYDLERGTACAFRAKES